MRLIVTGASGWVGRAVAAHAAKQGIHVVAVTRSSRAEGPWTEMVTGDFSTDDVLKVHAAGAVRGADAIIHCAGAAHKVRETPADVEQLFQVNRNGSERLMQLAEMAGIAHVVYVSTIAIYDWSAGSRFDENGPLAPNTAYGRSKLEGELICRNSPLDWRIARLATVYGPGDEANVARLVRGLRTRRFVIPGAGDAEKSMIPIDRAAQMLIRMASASAPKRSIINLAAPHTPTLNEICEAISVVCGLSRPRHIPLGLMRALARIGDGVDKVVGRSPFDSNTLSKLLKSTTVDVSEMLRHFGDDGWVPFATAFREYASYYRGC